MNSKKETLLSYLYNHSTWSSRNDLSNFLNVSTRQVTNYINEINKNETIVLSSNKGYKINPKFIGKDTFNKLGYKAKINTHTTSYIN